MKWTGKKRRGLSNQWAKQRKMDWSGRSRQTGDGGGMALIPNLRLFLYSIWHSRVWQHFCYFPWMFKKHSILYLHPVLNSEDLKHFHGLWISFMISISSRQPTLIEEGSKITAELYLWLYCFIYWQQILVNENCCHKNIFQFLWLKNYWGNSPFFRK